MCAAHLLAATRRAYPACISTVRTEPHQLRTLISAPNSTVGLPTRMKSHCQPHKPPLPSSSKIVAAIGPPMT